MFLDSALSGMESSTVQEQIQQKLRKMQVSVVYLQSYHYVKDIHGFRVMIIIIKILIM